MSARGVEVLVPPPTDRDRLVATAFGSESLPVAAWALACVAWVAVTWTWNGLHLAMTVDDTFYYFKTARNLSRGLGSTFDGLNPTNGYHPLWLVLLTAMSSLVGDDMAVFTRIVFTLQIALVWAGGLVLSRIRTAGGTRVLWPLALAMLNPFVAKIVLCGQETALQFLLSSVALWYWWSLRSEPVLCHPLEWARLALVCALVTFARLDGIFFCAVLLGMPFVLPSDVERAAGLGARLRRAALGLLVFEAGLLPYFAFNYLRFGHLGPVSGDIKLHLDHDEVAAPAARLAVSVLSVALALGFWAVARRKRGRPLALLAPAVGACLFLAVYNFGVRGEMSPSLIRIWYLEPHLLAAVIVTGVVLERPVLRSRGARAMGSIAFTGWLVVCGLAWRYRVEPRSYALYAAAERCSRWFEKNASPGTVGAAWDAGFAAAFTQKPVMNLDGLISSWEFKQRYLDLGKVDAFIFERQPVDYVIQYAWPRTLRGIASRFRREPVTTEPRLQTSVTGLRDLEALSRRWGVDLASFHVAHVECVMVSVATRPSVTEGPVHYFVLSRAALPGRPTLAEFALENARREACPPDDSAAPWTLLRGRRLEGLALLAADAHAVE